MSEAPVETIWEGRFVTVKRRGTWEYVSRSRDIRAVVILAKHDRKVVLVEQERIPIGRRCLELPAGLIGDEDENADVEDTAVRELEEETGFTAERIERIGEFYSSPGMVSESFTLVRAHGLTRVGEGGGVAGHEDITVHLVERGAIAAFVEERRAAGVGIDVRLLLLLGGAPFD
ncbi:MAG TPA: NUDIX hydrolase [Sphingomicrobium sp.]|nr:NUDIX hydrolase [Sphingomicrobium sp.]